MNTYKHRAFVEGTAVRLSVDTGHASVGYLFGLEGIRDDGERLWTVDFDPDATLDPSLTHGLAESTLVPVCEHAETFADDFGLACSEPGVPTSFDIRCGFDATRIVSFTYQGDRVGLNLCTDCAVRYALDLARDPDADLVLSEPITVESEAVTTWVPSEA